MELQQHVATVYVAGIVTTCIGNSFYYLLTHFTLGVYTIDTGESQCIVLVHMIGDTFSFPYDILYVARELVSRLTFAPRQQRMV